MQPQAAPAHEAHVFSVRELNRLVRDLLDSSLGTIWIEGELSNMARPASGHWYFSLKDRDAQVRCAMFRNRNRLLDFQAEAGEQVRLRARVGLYEARGDYQLIVEHMEPAGAGALARAFEALKRRLADEGLFADERKRPIPASPRCIGVVTSATGAALRDVLRVLARRAPATPIIVYPTPVQGDAAAPAIADMLARAGRRAECDVLLLVRGGGSLEDLQAFNEEQVARAIVACPIPIISGVGHEVDVSIADFAADRRAPTPSAAAEVAAPDVAELVRRLAGARSRLHHAMQRRLTRGRERGDRALGRLHRQHPERRLQQLRQRRDELTNRLQRAGVLVTERRRNRLDRIRARLHAISPRVRLTRMAERRERAVERLAAAMRTRLERADSRLGSVSRALQAVSPLATLGRGYALVRERDRGRPITRAEAVEPGQALDVQLAHGSLGVRVDHCYPDTDTIAAAGSSAPTDNTGNSTS